MNELFKSILEDFAGTETINCLCSLCDATLDFIEPGDLLLSDLSEHEIVEEFTWAVQQKLEREYQLIEYLVGEEIAEKEYIEGLPELYLYFSDNTKSFSFEENILQEMLGEDLLKDYELRLTKFINEINYGTTLKLLNIRGNYTA